jgi:hypothetical protein
MFRFIRFSMLGLALLMLALPFGTAKADQLRSCFPETGMCLGGRFREYWEQNGGLAVFGYPVTNERVELNRENGKSYITQWFERARFELHQENARPYDVLFGRLGADVNTYWQTEPRGSGPQAGCLWFAETSLNVCDQAAGQGFMSYWKSHGLLISGLDNYQRSLALFGYPITTARPEVNPTDGKTYMTQWFERARFEWHPDEPEPYKVLLGLLGSQVRTMAGASTTTPAGIIAVLRQGDLFIENAANNDIHRLTQTQHAGGVTWSRDGQHFTFTENGGLFVGEVSYDPAQPNGGNLSVAVQSRVATINPQTFGSISWSPDGARLAYQQDGNIYLANVDGSGTSALVSTGAVTAGPAWSPDGAKIAFVQDKDVYIVGTDGKNATNITNESAFYGDLVWTPDGSKLTFFRGKDGSGIWTIKPDGSDLTLLTGDLTQALSSSPSWSNNGTQLLYSRYRYDISKTDVVISNGLNLTANYAGSYSLPVWSADNAFVAFKAGDFNTEGPIYTMHANGTDPVLLTEGQQVIWSPLR